MKTTLPNGLTVLLQENRAAAVVAFQAWVHVGSADEEPEVAGIAHVFEHMLFKGTAHRGVGQIAREVEAAGGEINAWTSFDQTVFHLVLASRFFDTGLDIIADALQRSAFDPDELARELKVVMEEIKQGEDNPGRVVSQALFQTSFSRHPYRRPVIGTARTVRRLTRERLLEFFGRYYVPGNITLVVVGDFDAAAALAKIERAFPAGKPTKVARPARAEPTQRAPRATVVTQDVREAHLSLGFHIPGIRHEDTGALDLAAVLLGQGDSSHLALEVKRNRQLVNDVYAYSYTPRDLGLLVLGASLAPGNVEEATRAILQEAFRLGREEVSAEELAKAKTIVESDTVYQKETVQGMARKLGFFEVVAGDVRFEQDYQRQVSEVTPARLREVVGRYLTAANVTAAALVPVGEGGAASAAAVERLRARLPELAREEERQAAARWAGVVGPGAVVPADEVVRRVLPGGARVLIKRDPSVPLLAVRAVWNGGVRWEDERNNGINNLLAAMVTKGTATRSAEELAREVEGMAGSMGGFSGRNSFGLRAELLARHWERGLELLADCLLHPAFSEEELDKEKRQVIEDLRAQEDNLTQVAFRQFAEAFFRRHPYRLDGLGTPDSIAGLTRRRLGDYYRRNFRPDNVTIAVVGDVDPTRVVAKLTALLGAAPAARPAPAPSVPAEPPPPAGARQVFKLLNRAQAHVVIGFPGTSLSHPDRFALEVLSTILSGQGGRLFVELRERLALAYRVSAFSLEGIDPGYFAFYIATSPENLDAALRGMWAEIERVRAEPVPADELERAKSYLVGAHEISLQRRAALASTLAFHECYGLGWDEYRRYAPGVLAVTAADVQRVAREHLDSARSVTSIVRPEELTPGAQQRLRGKAGARPPAPPGSKAGRASVRGSAVDDAERLR